MIAFCIEHGDHHDTDLADPSCEMEDGMGNPVQLDWAEPAPPPMAVYIGQAESARIEWVTFPPGATVGKVPCHECLGTGWWGYGPTADECGHCIVCKGTGREWVGLL